MCTLYTLADHFGIKLPTHYSTNKCSFSSLANKWKWWVCILQSLFITQSGNKNECVRTCAWWWSVYKSHFDVPQYKRRDKWQQMDFRISFAQQFENQCSNRVEKKHNIFLWHMAKSRWHRFYHNGKHSYTHAAIAHTHTYPARGLHF